MKNLFILFSLLLIIACGSKEQTQQEPAQQEMQQVQQNEQVSSIWNIVDVVDGFGDKIEGKSAIVGTFEGTYSNSVVQDGKLNVNAQVSRAKDGFFMVFELLEEGNIKATLPEKELINVRVKYEDGTSEFIRMFMMSGTLTDSDAILLERLKKGETIKILLDLSKVNQYMSDTYLFEVNGEGLDELM